MPPSRHSSSSHSSSSRSSSSHSSSHSYSSHSSSRSYSSGSSSSRSYGSSYSGGSSYHRSPSPHSSSSHSSRPAAGRPSYQQTYRPSPAPAPRRPRVNQPSGFRPLGGMGTSWLIGRRHDYIYYPIAWTDTSTGRYYEKGYYDENGQRYENVAFEKNGKYENVICHCPYCDQDTILTLDADNISHSLQCPHCNGPMELKTQLDEYSGSTQSSSNTGTVYGNRTAEAPKKKKHIWLWIVAGFVALGILGNVIEDKEPQEIYDPPQQGYVINYSDNSNVSLFGETVYLKQNAEGEYRITNDAGSPDKVMEWSDYDDSYYDAESDCWIWCNTDMDPYVWQYWYEGISSDYGDFGWMEHDDTGWYIEASQNNWIRLPEQYDTSGLWYIAD